MIEILRCDTVGVWEEKAHLPLSRAVSLEGFWISGTVMVAGGRCFGSDFGGLWRFCLLGVSSLFIEG